MANLILGSDSDRYVWMPVVVKPQMDGGKTARITFEAKLKDPGQARVDEIFAANASDAEVVDEMLAGWRNVRGIDWPDGSEIEYEDDVKREAFLNFVGIRAGIANAWLKLVRPAVGQRKN